jgi:hypothetical protein
LEIAIDRPLRFGVAIYLNAEKIAWVLLVKLTLRDIVSRVNCGAVRLL